MRIGGYVPATAWVSLRMAQQTLVQAAAHASQPTGKPVTAPDPIQASPAARPLSRGGIDVRV